MARITALIYSVSSFIAKSVHENWAIFHILFEVKVRSVISKDFVKLLILSLKDVYRQILTFEHLFCPILK